jgi:hypothetical protein
MRQKLAKKIRRLVKSQMYDIKTRKESLAVNKDVTFKKIYRRAKKNWILKRQMK